MLMDIIVSKAGLEDKNVRITGQPDSYMLLFCD